MLDLNSEQQNPEVLYHFSDKCRGIQEPIHVQSQKLYEQNWNGLQDKNKAQNHIGFNLEIHLKIVIHSEGKTRALAHDRM